MKKVRLADHAREDLDEIWLTIAIDYGVAVVRVVWGGRDLKALEYPPAE